MVKGNKKPARHPVSVRVGGLAGGGPGGNVVWRGRLSSWWQRAQLWGLGRGRLSIWQRKLPGCCHRLVSRGACLPRRRTGCGGCRRHRRFRRLFRCCCRRLRCRCRPIRTCRGRLGLPCWGKLRFSWTGKVGTRRRRRRGRRVCRFFWHQP